MESLIFPSRNLYFYVDGPRDLPVSFTKARYIRYMQVDYRHMLSPIKRGISEEDQKRESIYEKLKNVDATKYYKH